MEVLESIDGLLKGLKQNYPRSGQIRWGSRMQRFLGLVTNLGSADPGDIVIGEHTIKVAAKQRDALYVCYFAAVPQSFCAPTTWP